MASAGAILIVFGGLPGVGKTTLAREVAARHRACYLRIDALEQAIRDAGPSGAKLGTAGYAAANSQAEAALKLGGTVVIDGVNPVEESRRAWRAIAARTSAAILEIEAICSNPAEHRRRVESRQSDIPGLVLPSWGEVSALRFEPWSEPHLTIDTARMGLPDILLELDRAIQKRTLPAESAGLILQTASARSPGADSDSLDAVEILRAPSEGLEHFK